MIFTPSLKFRANSTFVLKIHPISSTYTSCVQNYSIHDANSNNCNSVVYY